MRNIKRRIEKVEAKAQLLEQETNDRKAKLQEIQRLKKDNPMAALLLKRELETGRRYTLATLFAELSRSKAVAGEGTP